MQNKTPRLRLTGLGSELLEMGLFLNFKRLGSIMSVKFLPQKWLFLASERGNVFLSPQLGALLSKLDRTELGGTKSRQGLANAAAEAQHPRASSHSEGLERTMGAL